MFLLLGLVLRACARLLKLMTTELKLSSLGNANALMRILATGGINAAIGTMDPSDTWAVHAADTLKEGWFLSDYRNVELLCRGAPAAINDLVKYGVKFHREADDRLTQRFFGAHTYRRTCFVGDETGKAMLLALVKEAKKRKFPFYGETYIVSLMKSGDAVNGAIGVDMETKEDVVFNSKCVVLATGGHSRLYRVSSSRDYENTGDGILLGYEAGAELQDMEMVQFHPTGMVWPKKMWGVLVTEAVRGEGGQLFNAKNERFMSRYDKQHMELGPRDEVARSIYSEIMAGRGTKHNGAWMDISFREKSYILKRLPKMYRQFKAVGVDISKQRMEVAPTAHYSMGGLRVDFATGETRVAGLLAVGECTGGLHGANRLGGNSLAETIVFGKIVGARAANYKIDELKPINYVQTKAVLKELNTESGKVKPAVLKKQLQELMWTRAGIVKTTKDLSHALRELEGMKKQQLSKKDIFAYMDMKALLIAAETVVRSSLMRKECRGAFWNTDYKEGAMELANIICAKEDGMKVYTVSVEPVQGETKEVLDKNLQPKYHALE